MKSISWIILNLALSPNNINKISLKELHQNHPANKNWHPRFTFLFSFSWELLVWKYCIWRHLIFTARSHSSDLWLHASWKRWAKVRWTESFWGSVFSCIHFQTCLQRVNSGWGGFNINSSVCSTSSSSYLYDTGVSFWASTIISLHSSNTMISSLKWRKLCRSSKCFLLSQIRCWGFLSSCLCWFYF